VHFGLRLCFAGGRRHGGRVTDPSPAKYFFYKSAESDVRKRIERVSLWEIRKGQRHAGLLVIFNQQIRLSLEVLQRDEPTLRRQRHDSEVGLDESPLIIEPNLRQRMRRFTRVRVLEHKQTRLVTGKVSQRGEDVRDLIAIPMASAQDVIEIVVDDALRKLGV